MTGARAIGAKAIRQLRIGELEVESEQRPVI
jgi:hypothetical protein